MNILLFIVGILLFAGGILLIVYNKKITKWFLWDLRRKPDEVLRELREKTYRTFEEYKKKCKFSYVGGRYRGYLLSVVLIMFGLFVLSLSLS